MIQTLHPFLKKKTPQRRNARFSQSVDCTFRQLFCTRRCA